VRPLGLVQVMVPRSRCPLWRATRGGAIDVVTASPAMAGGTPASGSFGGARATLIARRKLPAWAGRWQALGCLIARSGS
jgi:hypothetical protein